MDLLTDLEALRESFLREARIYAKQGGMKDGDRPKDSTPWQQCCAISSGTYRVAAHELSKLIKRHRVSLASESEPVSEGENCE
jgi:hypothetical protein